MKKTIIAILFALPLFTACEALKTPLAKVDEVSSHTVTNTLPDLTTEVVTVLQTNSVYSVNPDLLTGINTAREVNNLTNPTPSAPLVELGLGALVAGLGWYAKIKNQKLKGAESLVSVLVQGVEKNGSKEVKQTIAEVSKLRGLSAELEKAVNS